MQSDPGRAKVRARISRVAALLCLLLAVMLTVAGTGAAATSPNLRRGVVDITTSLGYQNAAAAGTGMILTSSGLVLTNNHVIRGATTVRVFDPSTRRSYTATVLGYSVTSDVALLKVNTSSALPTVELADSAKVKIGQAVTALGNAGGTGTLTAAAGKVTALRRAITANDGDGNAQRLTGLIQTDAQLEPGDSGGPLFDRTGRVIGIDTAGSAGYRLESATSQGYAIPINRALAIVKQIQAGRASAAVHVGATAFLGISAQASGDAGGDVPAGAVLVVGVVPGSPADHAGLEPGDLITAINRQTVSSPDALTKLLLRQSVGATVELRWIDQLRAAETANVTLAAGPAQ
jgi:S1-C subfamily serine protease